ncbi:MAG TPA: hypothetical protein ENO20_10280 [Bacteroides sp.]|nr:hypothetical protein [Bacteroides sp.]
MRKLMMLTAAVALLGFSQLQAVSAFPVSEAKVFMQEVTWDEIERSELPQAVNDAFVKDYSDYTFKKALKGSNGHYKIKAEKDGTEYYFKYDGSGELLDSGMTADKKK